MTDLSKTFFGVPMLFPDVNNFVSRSRSGFHSPIERYKMGPQLRRQPLQNYVKSKAAIFTENVVLDILLPEIDFT